MAFGFICYNDAGDTQIDGQFHNYAVIEKFMSLSVNVAKRNCAPGDFSEDWYEKTITFSTALSQPPILFARSWGGFLYLANLIKTGGNFTGAKIWVEGGAGPYTVDIAVAVPAELVTPAVESHGMQVWDSSGGVAFDSRLPYAKVKYVGKYDANRLITHDSISGGGWFSLGTAYKFGGFTVQPLYYGTKNNSDTVIEWGPLEIGPYCNGVPVGPAYYSQEQENDTIVAVID